MIEDNKFAKTNLLEYSERFDEWTVASNSVITPNAIAAPDGSFTADKLYFSQTGSTNVSQNTTLIQNKTYTFSVYAKAVTPGSDNKFIPYINSPTPKFPTDNFEATSEWQRFTYTFTHTNASASTPVYILNKNDLYVTNVYFWGAQLEETELTEYTPSVDTFVSRASSATYVDDATGLIKTTPVNLYFPSVPAAAAWSTPTALTETDNYGIAPDGTQSSLRITATGSGYAQDNLSVVAGTTYTLSVHIKLEYLIHCFVNKCVCRSMCTNETQHY